MDDDRWPKPGVASLQNVSRLLLKIKETFWKKKKRRRIKTDIFRNIYIYTNTLLHLVGSSIFILNQNSPVEGNKPPPGVWYLTPHLTPAYDNSILLILIIRSTCSRNILICCLQNQLVFHMSFNKNSGHTAIF